MPSGLAKTILLYWQRNQLHTDTGLERLLEAGAILEPQATFNILSDILGLPEVAKMFKEAAEIGDGVLINSSNPKDLEEATRYIEEGASKANKPLDALDITAYTSFSVDEESEKAFKAAVPVVAFIIAGAPTRSWKNMT